MKYLFFDIECSNCFNGIGKMCEFGYVLTDENFNVLKKDDIPMSPGEGRGNRFHLKGRKNEKDLELAYDYDFYFTQPEFPHFYERIKALMEDPDTTCFAYSMDNDIPHLHHSCTRYKLRPFKYVCYDVQQFVAAYLEKKGQMSLFNACKSIVGPNSVVKLQEHLSRDDAEMEKLIFDAICTLTKCSSKELLEKSTFARTYSLEYMNHLEEKTKEKKRQAKARASSYKDEKAIGWEIYRQEARKAEGHEHDTELIGKRCAVTNQIKDDPNLIKTLIEKIKEKGYCLVFSMRNCDYLIAFDEENRDSLLASLKDQPTYKVILLKDIIH